MWTVLRKPSPLKTNHARAAQEFLSFSLTEKFYGDGQGANLAGADVTGSHSLEPARRRRGLDRRLVSDTKTTLRLGSYPTEQPYLGIALLTSHGEGTRKGVL